MSRVLAFRANPVIDRQDTDRDQVRAADACLSRIASRVIGASAKDAATTADLRSLLTAEKLIAGATAFPPRCRPVKIIIDGDPEREVYVTRFVAGRHQP